MGAFSRGEAPLVGVLVGDYARWTGKCPTCGAGFEGTIFDNVSRRLPAQCVGRGKGSGRAEEDECGRELHSVVCDGFGDFGAVRMQHLLEGMQVLLYSLHTLWHDVFVHCVQK